MAVITWDERGIANWTPTSYSTDQTSALEAVSIGEVVGAAFAKVRTAFNGTGGRTAVVGDGGSTNRFITTGLDITTASATPYIGVGAGFNSAPGYMYTAADTIDNVFTAATGGGPTVGALDFWFWIARADPH